MIRYLCFIMISLVGNLYSLTPQEIDELVEETRKEWNIPGLSIALIDKEKVYIAGYGVRSLESEEQVNPETLFQINSLTKAFTALTVSMLVDEGKLDWDKPIRTYLPHFALKDQAASEELTLRDLLSHRSGLPGLSQEGAKLYRNTNRSLEELIQRLQFVELADPLRSRFSYNNLAYAISAEITSTATKLPWTEFCRQKIFATLGMKRTFFSFSLFLSDANRAFPHSNSQIKPNVEYNWEKENMEGAAGIHSSANDMALWLQYCLDRPSVFLETQKPQMLIRPEDLCPDVELPLFSIISHGKPSLHYGFGWWIYNEENTPIYRHTGSSAGMQSVLAIVPEEKLGIVILSNHSKHPGVSCLMNKLLDLLLDKPETDWHRQGHAAMSQMVENKTKWRERLESIRNKNSPPSLALSEYAGAYTHPAYGTILIKKGPDELSFELVFSQEKGILSHWEGNSFEIKNISTAPLAPWICEFLISEDGKVLGLKMPQLGHFAHNNAETQ